MNDLLNTTAHVNGSPPGRGLPHLKLSDGELVRLAADLATGQRQLQPSLTQVNMLTGVPVVKIRQAIKARAAQHERADRKWGASPSPIRSLIRDRELRDLIDSLDDALDLVAFANDSLTPQRGGFLGGVLKEAIGYLRDLRERVAAE
jgi:hypothetical protein